MWGLELEWQVCPDGVELVEVPAMEPEDGRRFTIAGGDGSSRFFVPRTARREPISLRLDNLEAPLCVALINSAESDEKRLAFYAQHGLPVADRYDYELAIAREHQITRLLELACMGTEAAVHLINKQLAQHRAVVVPKLAASMPPRMTFAASSPIAYMLMEIAAIAEVGARRAICEYCGTVFLTGPSTGRRATARFCSDKHRTYWQRRKARDDAAKQ